jgi:hypothetical protein
MQLSVSFVERGGRIQQTVSFAADATAEVLSSLRIQAKGDMAELYEGERRLGTISLVSRTGVWRFEPCPPVLQVAAPVAAQAAPTGAAAA